MKVLTEDETMDRALSGWSLARYGDGELRNALGSHCKPQTADQKLARELRDVLAKPADRLLVCVPTLDGPKADRWARYRTPPYSKLLNPKAIYGSAFVTRPDSAPHVNRPDYWAKIRACWLGRDVVLVRGTKKSITPQMINGEASSLREVWGPERDAYASIDSIEEEIGTPSGTVILCLGPTATVLAARLARKGIHALDLGHVGMFARRLDVWKTEAA